MITIAYVVSWLIGISLGGLWYPVMFRVNSVFAWSATQDAKGGQALELFFRFGFLDVFLVWRESTLAVVILGRSGRLALHIASRNTKASSFHLHYFAHIFSQLYIFERYGQSLCHIISDGFHCMVC